LEERENLESGDEDCFEQDCLLERAFHQGDLDRSNRRDVPMLEGCYVDLLRDGGTEKGNVLSLVAIVDAHLVSV
jgi:hypothetical protein